MRRVPVYFLSAPEKVVNYTKRVYRMRPKKTVIFLQPLKAYSLYFIDTEKAERVRDWFYYNTPDTLVEEAWIEFLREMVIITKQQLSSS